MKDLSFLICQNLLIPFWFINILIAFCVTTKWFSVEWPCFLESGWKKQDSSKYPFLCPHWCRLHSSYLLSIFFKVWLLYRSVVIQFEKYFDNSKHENWGRLFGSIPTLIVLSVSISRHTTTSVCFIDNHTWNSLKIFHFLHFSDEKINNFHGV